MDTASAPSSPDLTTVPAVEAYLADTPFKARAVTVLGGGTANYAYRIHLTTPFEGRKTVVLKHAQPFVKTHTDLPFDLERQEFEVEAMTRIKSWLPDKSIVTVPTIFRFDKQNNSIIMEDCGEGAPTLKDFLRSGRASSPGLPEMIGTSLGMFLASMHDWSRDNPDGILDLFGGNLQAKKISAWATYGRLICTLNQEEVLPALSDPPIEVDKEDLDIITKIAADVQAAMMSACNVFVMGDFWPGNIMVKLDKEQQLQHLYLLDWEVAKTGVPGVELGQFCAEMHLLQRFDTVARDPALTVLNKFLEAYLQTSQLGADRQLARDTLVHWGGHLVVLTPRIPWGDKPSTRSVVKEGVQFLVGSRTEDFLTHSVVKALVPTWTLLRESTVEN